MNHVFIVNPVAGKGRAQKTVPIIKALFSTDKSLEGQAYSICYTEYPGHAVELARNSAAHGAQRIYSVGGDGTLNEVLNGMHDSGAALGIIPAGSGNDFIRSLIPAYRKNPAENKTLIADTIKAEPRFYDFAQANDRYFINASSMGFDAEVANNTNMLKKKYPIPLKFAYYAGILRSILRNYKRNIEIEIDGKLHKKTVLMVVIANGKYYGNNIPIAPSAYIDDGLLDICLIDWCTRSRILTVLPQVLKGKIESLQEFTHIRGKNIKIHSDEMLYLNFDGEIAETYDAIFTIYNRKIKIAVPEVPAAL